MEVKGDNERKGTSAPAVTAVGATKFLEFLRAERDAARPAIASGNVNKGFVNKFHGVALIRSLKRSSLQIKKPRQVGASRVSQGLVEVIDLCRGGNSRHADSLL